MDTGQESRAQPQQLLQSQAKILQPANQSILSLARQWTFLPSEWGVFFPASTSRTCHARRISHLVNWHYPNFPSFLEVISSFLKAIPRASVSTFNMKIFFLVNHAMMTDLPARNPHCVTRCPALSFPLIPVNESGSHDRRPIELLQYVGIKPVRLRVIRTATNYRSCYGHLSYCYSLPNLSAEVKNRLSRHCNLR